MLVLISSEQVKMPRKSLRPQSNPRLRVKELQKTDSKTTSVKQTALSFLVRRLQSQKVHHQVLTLETNNKHPQNKGSNNDTSRTISVEQTATEVVGGIKYSLPP